MLLCFFSCPKSPTGSPSQHLAGFSLGCLLCLFQGMITAELSREDQGKTGLYYLIQTGSLHLKKTKIPSSLVTLKFYQCLGDNLKILSSSTLGKLSIRSSCFFSAVGVFLPSFLCQLCPIHFTHSLILELLLLAYVSTCIGYLQFLIFFFCLRIIIYSSFCYMFYIMFKQLFIFFQFSNNIFNF